MNGAVSHYSPEQILHCFGLLRDGLSAVDSGPLLLDVASAPPRANRRPTHLQAFLACHRSTRDAPKAANSYPLVWPDLA